MRKAVVAEIAYAAVLASTRLIFRRKTQTPIGAKYISNMVPSIRPIDAWPPGASAFSRACAANHMATNRATKNAKAAGLLFIDQPANPAMSTRRGGAANSHAHWGTVASGLEALATAKTAQYQKHMAPRGIEIRRPRASGATAMLDATNCKNQLIRRTAVRIAGWARAVRREIPDMDIHYPCPAKAQSLMSATGRERTLSRRRFEGRLAGHE